MFTFDLDNCVRIVSVSTGMMEDRDLVIAYLVVSKPQHLA